MILHFPESRLKWHHHWLKQERLNAEEEVRCALECCAMNEERRQELLAAAHDRVQAAKHWQFFNRNVA